MKVVVLITFFVGLAIGFLIVKYVDYLNLIFQPINECSDVNLSSGDISEMTRTTAEDTKKIRILCFMNTSPKKHGERAVHVHQLWGKHCDKQLFASSLTDINIDALGFNVTDNHDSMWGKEKLMLQFIYRHFLNEYDWFYKADDDTFAIIENMRFFLSAYSPEDPIYFGYKLNYKGSNRGYFGGGTGYVMSRKAVRIFVENILTNPHFYRGKNVSNNVCHIETDYEIEDLHISVCFEEYSVYAGDGRDVLKRDLFMGYKPEDQFFQKPKGYRGRHYYSNTDEGVEQSSNYSIGFHHISGQYQYRMYFLTYKLQLFGINRQFPPLSRKKIYSEVVKQLDAEALNKTLRG